MSHSSPQTADSSALSSGKRHPLPMVKVAFRERTFGETFHGYTLTEKPGEHGYESRTEKFFTGTPIKGKWLYIFESGSQKNRLVYGGKPDDGKPVPLLRADIPHLAFLSRDSLSEKRISYYSDRENVRLLIERSEVFRPADHSATPVFLVEFVAMSKRLKDSYVLACDNSQRLLANPQVQLAHLAKQVAHVNESFGDALASDFPELLKFEREALIEQRKLSEDIVIRQRALNDLKNTAGFCRSMDDLLARDPSGKDAELVWDACTAEDETAYLCTLAQNKQPMSRQAWYDKLQLVRPISQMIAGGALYSAIRKRLITRFMALEAKALVELPNARNALKEAMKNFAAEIEGILSEHPSLVRGMKQRGGHTFYLEKSGDGNGFKLKWSAEASGAEQILSREVTHDSGFAKAMTFEKGMLSICAAVEIVNVYTSYRLFAEAWGNGKADAKGAFTLSNDTATGLGAVMALGGALTKGESVAGEVGAELAETLAKRMGSAAVGLGVVGSTIGVGLALAGVWQAHADNKTGDMAAQGFSLASNVAGVVIGALQLAGMFGAEGAAIVLATGPWGVVILFGLAAGAAFATWLFSDRIEKWPDECREACRNVGLKWDNLYFKPFLPNMTLALGKESKHLLSLLYPFDALCRTAQNVYPISGVLGFGGKVEITEAFQIEVKAGAWLDARAKFLIRDLKLEPALREVPPSLDINQSSCKRGGDDIFLFDVPLLGPISGHRTDYSMNVSIDLHGDGSVITDSKSVSGKLKEKEYHF